MPYEEEEDRGCEVKCPKGGGVCGIEGNCYKIVNCYFCSRFGCANSILLSKNSVYFRVFRVR